MKYKSDVMSILSSSIGGVYLELETRNRFIHFSGRTVFVRHISESKASLIEKTRVETHSPTLFDVYKKMIFKSIIHLTKGVAFHKPITIDMAIMIGKDIKLIKFYMSDRTKSHDAYLISDDGFHVIHQTTKDCYVALSKMITHMVLPEEQQ